MNIFLSYEWRLKKKSYQFINMLFRQETTKNSKNTEKNSMEWINIWMNKSKKLFLKKWLVRNNIFQFLNKQATREYFSVGFILL